MTVTHQHIEIVLSRLLHAWRYLPKALEEIDTWDIGTQIAYIEEWSPDEQLLNVMQEYDRDGVLTADQTARYQELLTLAQKNRPLLDQLRES